VDAGDADRALVNPLPDPRHEVQGQVVAELGTGDALLKDLVDEFLAARVTVRVPVS